MWKNFKKIKEILMENKLLLLLFMLSLYVAIANLNTKYSGEKVMIYSDLDSLDKEEILKLKLDNSAKIKEILLNEKAKKLGITPIHMQYPQIEDYKNMFIQNRKNAVKLLVFDMHGKPTKELDDFEGLVVLAVTPTVSYFAIGGKTYYLENLKE